MIERRSLFCNFKVDIYLIIVIIIFIILCVSYIVVIPVFEAPDEQGHFLYAFYISKYNRIPSQYNEPISTTQYIKENIDKNADKVFYMDDKYMFYRMPYSSPSGYLWYYRDQRHQPPLYYLISSQVIKPLGVSNINAEINYGNYNNPNRFINNKILKDASPTIFLVLILRLFQVVYGVLIIIFIYKIIKLLSNDKFEKKSIFLISGISFLPQFLFLCSYVNNDVLSALFGLVSVYFMVLLFKRNKAYLGLLSILFSIIASFTKPTILIMVPVTIVGLIVWAITKKKRIEAGWEDSYKGKNEEERGNNLGTNYGLNFDGKSNRVSILSTPPSAVKELTVEAWVYFNKFNKIAGHISIPIVSDWNSWSPDNQKGYVIMAVYYL